MLVGHAVSVGGLSWRSGRLLGVLNLGAMVVNGLLPAAAAWLTKLVVDGVAGGRPGGALVGVAAGLAGIGLLAATLPYVSGYLQAEQGRRLDVCLQDRLYTAINGFDGLSRFESPAFRDRLNLATQATGNAMSAATMGMLGLVRNLITLASLTATLWLLSPLMTGVVLAAGVPALVAQIWLSRREMNILEQLSPAMRRHVFFATILSDVQAAKEVRLFGLGRLLKGRLLNGLQQVQAGERRSERIAMGVQSSLALLAAVVSGTGLVWAVYAAGNGQLSVGSVSAFVAAVAGAQSAVVGLVGDVAGAYQALLVFDHYAAVTRLPNDLTGEPRYPRAPRLRRGIELRNVWFRYDEEHQWVLRGASFVIPAGRTVGVVGLNGAGKSTLVKLLCRFYDPQHGEILWDGVDIRELPVVELRGRMSVLFQDFMEYDLSAGENIGVGDPVFLHDGGQIRHAAQEAGVDETILGLPHGYDTMLSRVFGPEHEGATGAQLSGGQWQRLALARSLLRSGRDLLILDEPSAGLDAQAEYEIHWRLRRYRAGHTSILISHRLGVMRDADLIVVLGQGRVVEHGRHDQLVALGGAYARLFNVQASAYRIAG
ncbi:multidrug ABC transporter permease [Virgisporangium aurantiacum]|uniref:Multidrug ABC transporter permease n=1 Tax=Virgisporangium aurantiacum TaxID=175570 RepID=A0A8J3Z7Q1_9ACTN|nr:multidrug ABC transporter permease [Virgisporangium aurantiacum]